MQCSAVQGRAVVWSVEVSGQQLSTARGDDTDVHLTTCSTCFTDLSLARTSRRNVSMSVCNTCVLLFMLVTVAHAGVSTKHQPQLTGQTFSCSDYRIDRPFVTAIPVTAARVISACHVCASRLLLMLVFHSHLKMHFFRRCFS